MKTNKLKLKDLKVNSFVTALNDKNAQTVQGGATQNHCLSLGCSIVDCNYTQVVAFCHQV